MKDILIPLGGLLFIGLLAFAMIREGRKQRKAKNKLFRDFAHHYGLEYMKEDDGTAQEFGKDFDGVGRFSSSSIGKVIPKNVVTGSIDGEKVILFWHYIRYSEGWTREWFVAGLIMDSPIVKRSSVQFCRRNADRDTMHLGDGIVKELNVELFNLIVRAASPADAGKLLDENVLRQLAVLAEKLPFRPEIQVRANRIIAYPADRNAQLDDMKSLNDLFEFARGVAHL
jgi:hypothetical protein